MLDEASLINRMKEGDRAAFNLLYKRYYRSLHAYAKLLVDADDADDIVQDLFVNIWIHCDRLDASQSFRGYLFRSLYHLALNVIKRGTYKKAYVKTSEQEIQELEISRYDPDKNETILKLYNADLRSQITNAINSLPPKCKEVFLLSYVQQMPSKEISKRLEISLRTVENHIYSALKQLRKKLSGRYMLVLLWLFWIMVS